MTYDPHFDSDLDALLEAGKVVPPLPDVVRARSLARARASATTAAASPFATALAPRRPRLTVALAASAAVAIVGASALAALGLRALRPSVPVPAPATRTSHPRGSEPRPPAETPAPAPVPSPGVAPATTVAPKPQRRPVRPTSQASYAIEVALLQRAQVAYAGGDYLDALAQVAEHGRRFPNGRLAEERESLRVRALTSAGRTDEAQRAAAAFANRFPRSVLLSRPARESR